MMCFRSQSPVSFQFLIMPANLPRQRCLSLVCSREPALLVTVMFVQEAWLK